MLLLLPLIQTSLTVRQVHAAECEHFAILRDDDGILFSAICQPETETEQTLFQSTT